MVETLPFGTIGKSLLHYFEYYDVRDAKELGLGI